MTLRPVSTVAIRGLSTTATSEPEVTVKDDEPPVPEPVLGGAAMVMFGAVAASAGLALLVYGVAGKRGVVTRSLYSLGGMLIIGAIGGIFALSMEQAPAMLPLFVAGAGVGIVAVLTQAPKRA